MDCVTPFPRRGRPTQRDRFHGSGSKPFLLRSKEFGNDVYRRLAILLAYDTVVTETEFMNRRVVPRERFVYPAKAATFIMGIAQGELQEPAPTEDRQADQRAPTDESSIGQRPEVQ